MPDGTPRGLAGLAPATPRLLRGLVLLTLAVRVAAILWFRTYLGDAGAYEHEEIAQALLRGEGFAFRFFSDVAEPTGHQAPALPALLALGYAIFGPGAAMGRLAVQLVFAGLAAAAALALGRLAWRWWSERAAIAAMLGFALYPAFVYMPTRIQSINWTLPFLFFALAGFVAMVEGRGGTRVALWTGIAGGLGALGEPILAAPFALCWLYAAWRVHAAPPEERAGARRDVLVVAASCALVLAPWLARNALVLGAPGFVKSSFGYVAWQGNHRGASGTDKRPVADSVARALAWTWRSGRSTEALLDAARAQAVSVDVALSAADSAALRALPNERSRMAWFRARLVEDLAAEPVAYVRVVGKRLGMLLWFDPTNPRSFVAAYRVPYLLLALTALVGIVLGLRRRQLAPGLVLWALALVGLSGVFVFVIASARFRLPIEALLMLPAAYAVHRAVRGAAPVL